MELFAISNKENVLVKLFDDLVKMDFTYQCNNLGETIEVVRLDD